MNPLPPASLAFLYSRVSTDQQDTERQDAMLDAYCRGMDVVGRFADPDTSGSIPMRQREGGGALIVELERRCAGLPLLGERAGVRASQPSIQPFILVAAEQDRIGRDLLDIVATVRTLWGLGVTPHFSAEGGAFPRTPENELFLGVRASAAQYERDKIRQRIRDKMRQKMGAGELIGTLPYGFDLEPSTQEPSTINRLIPNLAEQHWIRRMAGWRAEGLSYNKIAKALNAHGVSTKTGSGPWQCGNVQGVLQSKHTKRLLTADCTDNTDEVIADA